MSVQEQKSLIVASFCSKLNFHFQLLWEVKHSFAKDCTYMLQNPKKSLDRFEKQMRKYKERKGLKNAATRAVSISVNGSKMAL